MSAAAPSIRARPRAVSRDAERAAARPLTTRECEIAAWIAQGKTNSEIAVILGPSRRTIEKHVEHILAKLGVENRLAIALNFERR